MQAVRSKNTQPELLVRKILTALGYRYRLHGTNLPGRPDIVFPGREKAIFVHGCFWHFHGCKNGQLPKSREDYWEPKLQKNKRRDALKARELKRLGWKVLVIWQCQLKATSSISEKLVEFLG
jgi:DNA mismatch endonuclease (patch repair protein)